MSEITRYVLVGLDNTEGSFEYSDFDEAVRVAKATGQTAVIERVYTYEDSGLVWTPDGSGVWPPKRGTR